MTSLFSTNCSQKKPNLIIIYTGTNDIQNNVNTLQKIRKVISSIRECDTGDNINIALSSMIHQSDHDFEDKVKPFVPETPFLYTLKTDHRKVFYCFQGVEKLETNWKRMVNETNRKLENLCKGKGMIFINDSNIDSTCLNRSKLHLNKSGTSLLIKNFSKVVNSGS